MTQNRNFGVWVKSLGFFLIGLVFIQGISFKHHCERTNITSLILGGLFGHDSCIQHHSQNNCDHNGSCHSSPTSHDQESCSSTCCEITSNTTIFAAFSYDYLGVKHKKQHKSLEFSPFSLSVNNSKISTLPVQALLMFLHLFSTKNQLILIISSVVLLC